MNACMLVATCSRRKSYLAISRDRAGVSQFSQFVDGHVLENGSALDFQPLSRLPSDINSAFCILFLLENLFDTPNDPLVDA